MTSQDKTHPFDFLQLIEFGLQVTIHLLGCLDDFSFLCNFISYVSNLGLHPVGASDESTPQFVVTTLPLVDLIIQ
jgi:hypothetical protein